MANATGVRHSADRPAAEQDRALRDLSRQDGARSTEGQWEGMPDPERHAALIALATPELDRVYDKIKGCGYSLMLMDASGLVLYERSEPVLKDAIRICPLMSPPTPAAASEDTALAVVQLGGRFEHETLTLEDLAGEDPQMLRNARSAYRIADSNVSVLIQGRLLPSTARLSPKP
jgi:hypothetical protein